MGKRLVRISLPEVYCPGNQSAITEIRHMSAVGLYRAVMEQPDEFFELGSTDFALLMYHDQAEVSAHIEESVFRQRIQKIKEKYNFLTYAQIMKILTLKFFTKRGL